MTDFEEVQIRRQGATNRQSSEDEFDPIVNVPAMPEGTKDNASKVIGAFVDLSNQLYKELIEAGVAKECARMVLPLTTQTKIYMKGSVRSWIHYLQIRCDGHTQLEHRQIAEQISEIFLSIFPNISNALNGTK